MAAVVKTLLTDCIQQALGLPRDPIATDVRDLALAVYNEQGRNIWDAWPWDNEKVDEFTAGAPDADGYITFAATVDVIRAIRAYTSDEDTATRVWSEDEIIAASNGMNISSDRFQQVADSGGCRRIRVSPDADASTTYRVLALKRWVDATVEATYDSTNPSATPTDYRYLTFAIDRAESALREFIKDALREWDSRKPMGLGSSLLNVALKRDQLDADRDRRMNPKVPMFEETNNWW